MIQCNATSEIANGKKILGYIYIRGMILNGNSIPLE